MTATQAAASSMEAEAFALIVGGGPMGLAAAAYRCKLVLIHPDQHVSRHGDTVADPLAAIDRARRIRCPGTGPWNQCLLTIVMPSRHTNGSRYTLDRLRRSAEQ